jgi:hypothetical protein
MSVHPGPLPRMCFSGALLYLLPLLRFGRRGPGRGGSIAREFWFPPSSTLPPLVPRGERETFGTLSVTLRPPLNTYSPPGKGRIVRRVLETPESSCSATIPSASNQDAVTNPAMSELSERVDGCSLSPRERVRVRGNEACISIQMSEMETCTARVSIPTLFESSSFAPRICIIP